MYRCDDREFLVFVAETDVVCAIEHLWTLGSLLSKLWLRRQYVEAEHALGEPALIVAYRRMQMPPLFSHLVINEARFELALVHGAGEPLRLSKVLRARRHLDYVVLVLDHEGHGC